MDPLGTVLEDARLGPAAHLDDFTHLHCRRHASRHRNRHWRGDASRDGHRCICGDARCRRVWPRADAGLYVAIAGWRSGGKREGALLRPGRPTVDGNWTMGADVGKLLFASHARVAETGNGFLFRLKGKQRDLEYWPAGGGYGR